MGDECYVCTLGYIGLFACFSSYYWKKPMIYQTKSVSSKPLFVLVWCETHKKAFGCFSFREFVADSECHRRLVSWLLLLLRCTCWRWIRFEAHKTASSWWNFECSGFPEFVAYSEWWVLWLLATSSASGGAVLALEKKNQWMNEDDREKEILKQKTKSTLNWCTEKKEKKGKIVYIEKNRISKPRRTRFIFILFLRKSCLRK